MERDIELITHSSPYYSPLISLLLSFALSFLLAKPTNNFA
jgi:hypothetical protein